MSARSWAAADVLERDAELARIEAAVARAQGGHGSLLVVEGPAGIGKSALIGAARARCPTPRATRTLRARGGELERDFAFGVVRQLLEPALAEVPPGRAPTCSRAPAGVAGAAARPARARAPDGGERQRRPTRRSPSCTASTGCARTSRRDRPLVLTVDDAHWADAPSLRFLAFLLPRLEELPRRARRRDAPREAEAATAPLLALCSPIRCAERPAPGAADPRRRSGAVIETGSGARAGARLRRRLPARDRRHRRSSCASSSRRCARTASTPTAAAAPRVEALGARTVGRSIAACGLSRLPEVAVRLARAVAVLETARAARRPPTLAGVGRSTRRPRRPTCWSPPASSSRGARWRFAHPIVRAGISRRCHRPSACAPTARAAELLAVREDAGERVAEHLLATEPARRRRGWWSG